MSVPATLCLDSEGEKICKIHSLSIQWSPPQHARNGISLSERTHIVIPNKPRHLLRSEISGKTRSAINQLECVSFDNLLLLLHETRGREKACQDLQLVREPNSTVAQQTQLWQR